ncbi:MAG: GxxExxY protein [Candidatus Hydrogenedentota bacterium]
MDINDMTGRVIKHCYDIHNLLGPGFLEKVYENALYMELEAEGFDVKQQHPIPVSYKGVVVGDYSADLVVDDRLIIELKAIQNIGKEHEVQLVNYLAATGIDNGLLVNFGSSVEVKRKFRRYRNRHDLQD